jgi:hypothetical protein
VLAFTHLPPTLLLLRVPYLCEGDHLQAYYVLDNAVLLLSHPQAGDPSLSTFTISLNEEDDDVELSSYKLLNENSKGGKIRGGSIFDEEENEEEEEENEDDDDEDVEEESEYDEEAEEEEFSGGVDFDEF